MSGDGAMTLPAKENALFKQVVRCYETKTFKKGLKTADSILKKFPNHGETLSMKGLILGNMEGEGLRDQAHECVKLGIKNDVESHVCWHVYGLLHRIDRNYKEAIKCYRVALKIDEGNLQILRDLSYMQMQTRQIDEFVTTRNEILKQRPSNRVNWMSIVAAQHYAGNHEKALETFAKYEKSVPDPSSQGEDPKTAKFELSETHMFKAQILEKAGKLEEALALLEEKAKHEIVDQVGWMVQNGRLRLSLAEASAASELDSERSAEHRKKASTLFRRLVDRMPDNHEWHLMLRRALAIEGEDLRKLYAELGARHPSAEYCKRAPLDFLTGVEFEEALRKYVEPPLRKGVPSLFRELSGLYSDADKVKTMGKVFSDTSARLRDFGTFPGSSEKESKPLFVLAHALTLLSYHQDAIGDREEALKTIDSAIDLNVEDAGGEIVELRLAKAAFLKRCGDYAGAVAESQIARRADLADRYLNGSCVKRLLQNDEHEEAERTAALFARDGDQASNLYDMQCCWFENEAGWCHLRGDRRGRALKYFAAVVKHYEDMEEDQFDFHNYCMRKMTLRSYVEMLRAEDALYDKPRFREAADGLIGAYLSIHDRPPRDADAEEEELLASLPKEERQKIRKKRAKEKEKKEKEEAAAREKEAAERAVAALALEKDGKKPQPKSEKPVDPDPLGVGLLYTKTPLEDALRVVSLLERHASRRLKTHAWAFQIYIRMKKLPLALRAVKRALAIDPDAFQVKRDVTAFAAAAFEAQKTAADPEDPLSRVTIAGVRELLGESLSVEQYAESVLAASAVSGSPPDCASAAEACRFAYGNAVGEYTGTRAAAAAAAAAANAVVRGVPVKVLAETLGRFEKVDARAAETFRVSCEAAYPRARAFMAKK